MREIRFVLKVSRISFLERQGQWGNVHRRVFHISHFVVSSFCGFMLRGKNWNY